MPRSYTRKEGQIPYVEGNQGRLQLSRNYHEKHLLCRLDVDYTNDGSLEAFDHHFANLINSIQVVANGNRTIKQVDPKKFIFNSIFTHGRKMTPTGPTTTTGQHSYTMHFMIPFTQDDMIRPTDTIENTALYTTYDLLVDWASPTSVCSGGVGLTINSASLVVSSAQLVGYQRNAGEKIAHYVETRLKQEITSSTTEFQINLPVKKVYQSLLLYVDVGGFASNSVINNVKLKSGTTIFLDMSAQDLRADNIIDNNIITASDIDGALLIDLVGRSRNSDALDTRGEFNTLELVLDVTLDDSDTNNITVYSDVLDIESVPEVKG